MNCEVLWEVFTNAIIPIVVAVSGVYFAEYFARKRDYKQKIIEIQIDYMRKEIEYLSKMENLLFTVSREVDECLGIRNPEERIKKYNEFLGHLSTLNEQNISSYYMLDCFNNAMNIGIDVVNYKKAIGTCSDNLKRICDTYMTECVTQQSEDEINKELHIAKEEIETAIRVITDKMVLDLTSI